MASTPRRATGRVTGVPRRVGRVLEQAVQSDSLYGESLDVSPDGRLDVRLAPDAGLEMTREGLRLSPSAAGEMNRPQLNRLDDVDTSGSSGAQIAALQAKMDELFAELRRTKNMKSGGL